MKIGLLTDSLSDLDLPAALDWVVAAGIEAVEISTGGWPPVPHCDPQTLLADGDERSRFLDAIQSRGLELSALNCNSNPVDPHDGRRKKTQEELFRTVELASKLGLSTIVTMSGCPGDPDGGDYPNWVTHPWPPEFGELLDWQWREQMTPFWRKFGAFASDHGVRIAIEMYPGQCVYSTRTLLRLREIVGPHLGANFDPSHLFHQGMDPVHVIRTLGPDCIFHVHAKDTRFDPYEMARTGVLDTRPFSEVHDRPWAYRTLGFGHDAKWWRDFVTALRAVGYDGVLSIEHEDVVMGSREGLEKSIEFLKPIILQTRPEIDSAGDQD